MIGHVIMEIGEQEMISAVQFYLNKSVFEASDSLRWQHKATVVGVRQRSNGNFVVEFEGGVSEKREESNT